METEAYSVEKRFKNVDWKPHCKSIAVKLFTIIFTVLNMTNPFIFTTAIALISFSVSTNARAQTKSMLSEKSSVLQGFDRKFLLYKEYINNKFRWISTPPNNVSIYGTHPHIFSFRTFGGKDHIDFTLKITGNDPDIVQAVKAISENRQQVGTARRNPFAGSSREERARLIENGMPVELIATEIFPPNPVRYDVKFEGIEKKKFEHYLAKAQIELTARDASGETISKKVSVTFGKPLEWIEPFEFESYIICNEEREYVSRVKYGIGTVKCEISGSDNYLNVANFEISSDQNTSEEVSFTVRYIPPRVCQNNENGTKMIKFNIRDSVVQGVGLKQEAEVYFCDDDNVYKCFGAIGEHCGKEDIEIFGIGQICPLCYFIVSGSTCESSECTINAGSWEHDECCFDNHGEGFMCGNIASDICLSQQLKGVDHYIGGLNWKRRVDIRKPNCTGNVIFNDYCAEANWIVHKDDVAKYCCSHRAERYEELAESNKTRVRANYLNSEPYLREDARVCLP